MKLKLEELKQKIPSIDLLDSRKIVGGNSYHGEGDYAWNIDIEEVEVRPDYSDEDDSLNEDRPEFDHEPNDEFDNDRDDQDYGEREEDRGDEQPDRNPEDGKCMARALAHALQERDPNLNWDDAMKQAEEKMREKGLDPEAGPPGVPHTLEDLESILEDLFDDADRLDPSERNSWGDWFDEGGGGVAYIDEYGHMIYLEGYDPDTGMFDFYDPGTGEHGQIGAGQIDAGYLF